MVKALNWGETIRGHILAILIAGTHPLRGEVLNYVMQP
jgi:hypothetical protein